MKEWKNKEIVIGLIIIIILGMIALFLLVRRETRNHSKESVESVVQETVESAEQEETGAVLAEEISENKTGEETETFKADEKQEEVVTGIQVLPHEKQEDAKEKEKKKIGLYDILGGESYVASTLTERKQEDNQLKELYEYWDAYKLDAVAEVVRLERLQKVSSQLEGTNKYYYYGSVDRLGRPSGKGLAVYGNNTYYFGEWKEGLRSGKGMWLEVAIYADDSLNLGLLEHSYNGQWSKDLPNGEGQEHFSYDYSLLKEESFEKEKCIANVIGNFKDGYYNGEMYIMTVDAEGNSTDWGGTCKEGSWSVVEKGYTYDTIWVSYEKDEQGNSQSYAILPEENLDWGVRGLKK